MPALEKNSWMSSANLEVKNHLIKFRSVSLIKWSHTCLLAHLKLSVISHGLYRWSLIFCYVTKQITNICSIFKKRSFDLIQLLLDDAENKITTEGVTSPASSTQSLTSILWPTVLSQFIYIRCIIEMVASNSKWHINHIDPQNRCCLFACQRTQLAINARLVFAHWLIVVFVY